MDNEAKQEPAEPHEFVPSTELCGGTTGRARRCSIKEITHMCTQPLMCPENVLVSSDRSTEGKKKVRSRYEGGKEKD